MTSSLRRRIFVGSVLWTVGMILLATAVFTVIIELHPGVLRPLEVHGFLRAPFTLLFGATSLGLGAWYVRRGLGRIDTLRSRLSGLHQGRDKRLEGRYPGEIQPLVDDLNSLLDTRERAIERAVAKAGDLAHGLKTPLAILAQDVDRARAAGQEDLAASISQQVVRMQRQVDYHLAQARAVASGATPGARSPVLDSAEGLRRAMLRLFADRRLVIDLDVPEDATVAVPREDLDEMLGNLIENACKWTATRVRITASRDDASIVITVDDDGRGIPVEMREAVLKRGVRADEAAPGSGLGLAIVRDVAELYGGSIALSDSPQGGLRASLRLLS
jgi:signal transduction histidine kinase